MAGRVGILKSFGSETTDSVGSIDSNNSIITSALNDASLGYVNGVASDTGSANNYIVTCPFGSPTVYNQGMTVAWIPANTNTGSSTLTVIPQPSVPLTDAGGNALSAGAIQSGVQAAAIYNGGSFRLLTAPGVGGGLLYKNVQATGGGNITLTVNCAGFSFVTIVVDSQTAGASAGMILQLQNVVNGSHLMIVWNPSTTTQTFKFSNACTDQAGNTITNITITDSAGHNVDMIGSFENGINFYMALIGTYALDTFSTGTATRSIRFLWGFH